MAFPQRLSRFNIGSAARSTAADNSRDNDERIQGATLRDLNNALRVLVDLFPDIQPDVFREMLPQLAPESRVQLVTEQILKSEDHLVQGRYRQEKQDQVHRPEARKASDRRNPGNARNRLLTSETFRSAGYRNAVRSTLAEEFQSLSKSTIMAVLAENNSLYTPSRAALLDVSSKSWRSSFSNFVFRRKSPSAKHHPLIIWPDSEDSGFLEEPTMKRTLSPELNQELYETLILPVRRQQREAQDVADLTLARRVQAEEAEEVGEMYDCECCYSSATVHEITSCDDGCHTICFSCIRRTVGEAVYGQGWARSIDNSRGSMKCIASSSDSCDGHIGRDTLRLAFEDENEMRATYTKFQERLAQKALQTSGLSLIHCPFCSYAEADEVVLITAFKWQLKRPSEFAFNMSGVFLTTVFTGLLPFILLIYTVVLLTSTSVFDFPVLKSSLERVARRRRGLRFDCLSPACGGSSCLQCHILWRDPHSCYSATADSLQKRLETAMTAAIKRVCPACNTSFVKSTGCNKLVCVCGYTMCYLCRQKITAEEGYDHFCQHFRPTGGRCRNCQKCELYRNEDEAAVIDEARQKAENDFWASEGKGADRVFLTQKQPFANQSVRWTEKKTWQDWLDMVVDRYLA